QADRKKAKDGIEQLIPDLTESVGQHQQKLDNFQSEKPRREGVLHEARDLQLKIADRQKTDAQVAKLESELIAKSQSVKTEIDALERAKRSRDIKLSELTERLTNIEGVVLEPLSDDWQAMSAQLKAFILAKEQEKEQLLAVGEYRSLLNDELKWSDETADLEAQLEQLERNLLSATDSRLEAEQQFQFAEEAREIMLQQNKLTDLRKSLTANEPCPVCGSLDHPVMEHWVVPSDELQKQLEEQYRKSQMRLDTAQSAESKLVREHALLSAKLDGRLENSALSARFEQRIQHLESVFAKQGLLDVDKPNQKINQIDSLLAELRKIAESVGEQMIDKADLNKQIQRLDQLIMEQTAHQKDIEKYGEQRLSRKAEMEEWTERISTMLGGLEVAEARAKLDQQENALREQLNQASAGVKEAETKLTATVEELDRLEQQLSDEKKKFKDLTASLSKDLEMIGVGSIAHARETLLDIESEQLLAEQISLQDKKLLSIEEALKTLDKQLQEYDVDTLKIEEEPKWRAELKEKEENRATQLRRQGALQEMLDQDELRKQELGKLFEEIELRERELTKWAALKELIGMKDGSKFREYAQGLTLARLVQLANQHLQALNGRYLLLKPGNKNLELEIVDTYQADNRRPTHTLSGGESFVLSLALALGLSDLAGRNTRIDSLFIDEGFGTLDSASLDLVLDVLDRLRGQGKTIGLISHVRTLQERIFHQVRILSHSDGFGRVQIV
ncbi:MAG: SbcC/MukB-like Walker B domain-containing protein, partial [Bacteroidota bacterium]